MQILIDELFWGESFVGSRVLLAHYSVTWSHTLMTRFSPSTDSAVALQPYWLVCTCRREILGICWLINMHHDVWYLVWYALLSLRDSLVTESVSVFWICVVLAYRSLAGSWIYQLCHIVCFPQGQKKGKSCFCSSSRQKPVTDTCLLEFQVKTFQTQRLVKPMSTCHGVNWWADEYEQSS